MFNAETASRQRLQEQKRGGSARGLNILMHHISWDINRPLLAGGFSSWSLCSASASKGSLILPITGVKLTTNRDADDSQAQAGIKDSDSHATPARFSNAAGVMSRQLL